MKNQQLPLGAKKQLKSFFSLSRTEGFNEKIEDIRREIEVSPQYFFSIENTAKRNNEAILAKALLRKKIISLLQTKFKLLEGFSEKEFDRVVDFVLFEQVRADTVNFQITLSNFGTGALRGIHIASGEVPAIFVEIFASTTKDDLIKNWKRIKAVQREYPECSEGQLRVIVEKNKLLLEIAKSTKPEDLNSIWRELASHQEQLPGYTDKPFRDYHLHSTHLKMIEEYEKGELTAKQVIEQSGLTMTEDYFYKLKSRIRKNSL